MYIYIYKNNNPLHQINSNNNNFAHCSSVILAEVTTFLGKSNQTHPSLHRRSLHPSLHLFLLACLIISWNRKQPFINGWLSIGWWTQSLHRKWLFHHVHPFQLGFKRKTADDTPPNISECHLKRDHFKTDNTAFSKGFVSFRGEVFQKRSFKKLDSQNAQTLNLEVFFLRFSTHFGDASLEYASPASSAGWRRQPSQVLLRRTNGQRFILMWSSSI